MGKGFFAIVSRHLYFLIMSGFIGFTIKTILLTDGYVVSWVLWTVNLKGELGAVGRISSLRPEILHIQHDEVS
ncbi:16201_t:CDS:2 [Funneliformis geosporum]|nr:16201_t:CDS:2 [Funneliformis geosporum]